MFNLTTKAYIAVTEAFNNFKKDERGVTAIEYGLIALAMATFIILVFGNDGGFIAQLKAKFDSLKDSVSGFVPNGGVKQ